MCIGKTPSYQPPAPMQQPQEAKQPEQAPGRARKDIQDAAGMAGSTMLTGVSGVEQNQLNLQKKTLLGA